MAILTTEAKTRINNYSEEFLAQFPNNDTVEVEGEEPVAKYTDSQWLDEVVKRYLVRCISRGAKILHEANLVQEDITLE